jgi:hypothetical protein
LNRLHDDDTQSNVVVVGVVRAFYHSHRVGHNYNFNTDRGGGLFDNNDNNNNNIVAFLFPLATLLSLLFGWKQQQQQQ